MPFDLEKLVASLFMMLVGSSIVLLTAAIAWRLTLKPTMRALLDYRATRGGADPVLSRRMTELEDEFRALKERVGPQPDRDPSRLLGTELPLRATKEKV